MMISIYLFCQFKSFDDVDDDDDINLSLLSIQVF